MKVGILTYYGVHNHGAVLQANALKTVISSMGHDCGFLSFSRNYDMIPQKQANKYKIGLNSIPFYFKYLLDKGLGNILYNVNKNRMLGQYRSQQLPMLERYSDFYGDVAVIGSDEVFSLEIGINPFFYGHGLKCGNVFSYAGCFGPTNIESVRHNELAELVSSGLKKMNAISVRDDNSRNVIKELTGQEAALVCDPVILYGYEKEMLEFKPPIDKYIAVYSYDRNMNDHAEVEKIRAYAKAKGMPVVSLGYYHKWCDKNIQASPNELLGWIKNASIVITDTFHGSVMSIICNTPIAVKLRGNANKLAFLLSEYGLEDRVMDSFDELDSVSNRVIDFDKVNRIIVERRTYSMRFLQNAFEGQKK